jgi:hypothetical protein
MQCLQAQGVVSCAGGIDSAVAFDGPPIPGVAAPTAPAPPSTESTPAAPTPATTESTPATAVSVEGPGSYEHSTDAEFCDEHECIENLPNGVGYIVQCADGE